MDDNNKNNLFTGGVNPGGLTSSIEIKILICYILSNINTPLTGEEIASILQTDGIANYFETVDAVEDLAKHGQITEISAEPPSFSVSDSGKEILLTLGNTVPHSAKEKALTSASKLLLKTKKLSENDAIITKANDGYIVECIVKDVGSDLLNLKLFSGTNEQAQKVKKKFLEDPTTIYRTILELLG